MASGEQRAEPGSAPAGETDLIETEQKYDVSPDFVLPDLAGAGGVTQTQPEVQTLAATYFDTADLRLAAAHITLRRRTGGGDAGWHIKLPVSADTRREVHFPLGGPRTTVPDDVAAHVAQWAAGPQLRPVALIETRRTVRRLTGPDGQILAEIADDQVTGSRPGPAGRPGWHQVGAWREIEIELVSGARAVLDAAAARLTAAGATRSPSASKLARVLGTS